MYYVGFLLVAVQRNKEKSLVSLNFSVILFPSLTKLRGRRSLPSISRLADVQQFSKVSLSRQEQITVKTLLLRTKQPKFQCKPSSTHHFDFDF